MKRTPLYELHVARGAKITPFAGYAMPLVYSSILEEHQAVRTRAGVFDVSHMGRFLVEGPDALTFLQHVTSNDPARLSPGRAQYSLFLNEQGGIVDDLVLYRLSENRFLLVVNAANAMKDWDHLHHHTPGFSVTLSDLTEAWAQIALQGPRSETVMKDLWRLDLSDVAFYHFVEVPIEGGHTLISRTGYTGEDGFEIYAPPEVIRKIFARLLDHPDVCPAGLGARDTLRLEMGYPLWGHDIDESTTPLEAGLSWTVVLAKEHFVGREALLRQKEEGIRRKRIGFASASRRDIPREGQTIEKEGAPVGKVTSGTLSPSLGVGIGMGYVPVEHTRVGGRLTIAGRRPFEVTVVRLPFYKQGSLKSPGKKGGA